LGKSARKAAPELRIIEEFGREFIRAIGAAE
jgi:hypothetical protein